MLTEQRDPKLSDVINSSGALAIRRLNDAFRHRLPHCPDGHRVVATRGVAAMTLKDQQELVVKVRDFDAFDASNDPHGEHDFGSLTQDGIRCFWKIDYYDAASRFGSDNPSDPLVTTRVLTIMLASEY